MFYFLCHSTTVPIPFLLQLNWMIISKYFEWIVIRHQIQMKFYFGHIQNRNTYLFNNIGDFIYIVPIGSLLQYTYQTNYLTSSELNISVVTWIVIGHFWMIILSLVTSNASIQWQVFIVKIDLRVFHYLVLC